MQARLVAPLRLPFLPGIPRVLVQGPRSVCGRHPVIHSSQKIVMVAIELLRAGLFETAGLGPSALPSENAVMILSSAGCIVSAIGFSPWAFGH